MPKYYKILPVFILASALFINSCPGGDNKTSNVDNTSADTPEFAAFTNVLSEVGFRNLGNLGQTASWGDFNNDGLIDIAIGNTDVSSRNRERQSFFLYENIGKAKFKEVTEKSGIQDQPVRSLTWADYDNDGFLDLAFGTTKGAAPPVLYKNNKNSTFKDVSSEAGFKTDEGTLFNAIWSDYNMDGYVDLFQINVREIHLYKNNGDGTFEDVASEAGINKVNFTKAGTVFDFNNDMYPDLFLANQYQDNFFINNGDGTFTDITDKSGLGYFRNVSTESACTGDINNDGYIDIYVGTGRKENGGGNILYRNNGDGTFTDITEQSGTGDVGDARTCSFADYNSDGLIDILTTNHLSANRLFKNLGNEKFEDVARIVGIHRPIIDVFGTSWADFNEDGYLDVFLNGHIGIGLMKNSGNGNNNLIIELVGNGTTTNVSAISSRVEVQSSGKKQTREVLGGGGCCEQNMLPVHFGMGNEDTADIVVKWTDGEVCEFNDFQIKRNTRFKVYQEDCVLEEL